MKGKTYLIIFALGAISSMGTLCQAQAKNQVEYTKARYPEFIVPATLTETNFAKLEDAVQLTDALHQLKVETTLGIDPIAKLLSEAGEPKIFYENQK